MRHMCMEIEHMSQRVRHTWHLLLEVLGVLRVCNGHFQKDGAQDVAPEHPIRLGLLHPAREFCYAPAAVLQLPQLDVLGIVQPLCLLCRTSSTCVRPCSMFAPKGEDIDKILAMSPPLLGIEQCLP